MYVEPGCIKKGQARKGDSCVQIRIEKCIEGIEHDSL